MKPLEGKKVLMVIAHTNFRDEEYAEPRAVLEEQGAAVTVASSAPGPCTGMLGARAQPDLLLEHAKAADYDAVLFIGGSGASEYWDDPRAHALAREAAALDRVVGAICIAPVTLAKAGLLRGRRATCYPSEAGQLQAHGARHTGAGVERDGNLVTADGPRSAKAFGLAVAKALGG